MQATLAWHSSVLEGVCAPRLAARSFFERTDTPVQVTPGSPPTESPVLRLEFPSKQGAEPRRMTEGEPGGSCEQQTQASAGSGTSDGTGAAAGSDASKKQRQRRTTPASPACRIAGCSQALTHSYNKASMRAGHAARSSPVGFHAPPLHASSLSVNRPVWQPLPGAAAPHLCRPPGRAADRGGGPGAGAALLPAGEHEQARAPAGSAAAGGWLCWCRRDVVVVVVWWWCAR